MSAPLAAPGVAAPGECTVQGGRGGEKQRQCGDRLCKHGNTFILHTETSG